MADVTFTVRGPFEVARDGHKRTWEVTLATGRRFWTLGELPALASRRGCYVFAIVPPGGGGYRPEYVGKTANNFRSACLNPYKLQVLREGLNNKAGKLWLFLIAHPAKPRGEISEIIKGDIRDLENQLIGLAYQQNPSLLNQQHVKKRLRIGGVLLPEPGAPSKEEQQFKKMFGLEKRSPLS